MFIYDSITADSFVQLRGGSASPTSSLPWFGESSDSGSCGFRVHLSERRPLAVVAGDFAVLAVLARLVVSGPFWRSRRTSSSSRR